MLTFQYAYDAGINAFDTANIYSAGESERILGVFLKKFNIPRSSVVILTKAYFLCGDEQDYGPAGAVNNKGLSRKASTTSAVEVLSLMDPASI